MVGKPIRLGPFKGGLNNSAGQGDYIKDDELYELVNLEVDTDGSLVNRPPMQVKSFGAVPDKIKSLGSFSTSTGKHYYVIKYINNNSNKDSVGLVDAEDFTSSPVILSSKEVKAGCVVQYQDRLYVIPAPGAGKVGGYFDSNLNWVDETALPEGETVAIYLERMWIGAGANATSQTSLVRFSAIGDASSWGANDNFNVNAGDGQNVTAIIVVFNDLFVFKTHSTYRVTAGANVLQAQRSTISTSIGTPNAYTVTLYNNRSLYLYHNGHVYELYNYNFTNISTAISTTRFAESSHDPICNVGLGIFSDRLFFTYYEKLYVMSMLSGKWCEWQTLTGSRTPWGIVSIQTSNGELMYASVTYHSNSTIESKRFFVAGPSRIYSDAVPESSGTIPIKLVTKTYDFDTSWAYKVAFWFGATAAVSSYLTFTATVPNIGSNYTWDEWSAKTWDELYNDPEIFWDNNTSVEYKDQVGPGLGGYARKMYKFKKKIRFRQAYLTLENYSRSNVSGSDSMVRIYDITAFVDAKETVVKELS